MVKRSGVKATDEQIKREYLVYVGTVDDFVQSIDSYYSGLETEGHSRLEYIRDAMESKLVSRLRKYINENEVKVESYRPKSEKLQRVRSELRGYSEKSLNLAEASLESLGSSNGINGNALTKLTDDYNGLADVLKTVIGSRLRDYSQGVFDRIDEQRRFIAQLILTLDVVLITFTPLFLMTGLEKLESSGARPLLYWFGLSGLILAVLSLAAGLLFYGCTSIALLGVPHYLFGIRKKMLAKNQLKVPREKMDKAVERNKLQWRLARTFARFETALFLAAILAIVTGVFVLLANVYCV